MTVIVMLNCTLKPIVLHHVYIYKYVQTIFSSGILCLLVYILVF